MKPVRRVLEDIVDKNAKKNSNGFTNTDAIVYANVLGANLRYGEEDARRARMLRELQASTHRREVDSFVESLTVCTDVSLGIDESHSDGIRNAAGDLRDAVTALPPSDTDVWEALQAAFAPKVTEIAAVTSTGSTAQCQTEPAATAPVATQLPLPPPPGDDEPDCSY